MLFRSSLSIICSIKFLETVSFSIISSLFFKNEVYLTYYMMYDSDASIKSPGILYYSILFTVFQLFTKQKKKRLHPGSFASFSCLLPVFPEICFSKACRRLIFLFISLTCDDQDDNRHNIRKHFYKLLCCPVQSR